MTATDRRAQGPRTVGLSVLALGMGALLLAAVSPAQAQDTAAAAQVPFPQGRAVVAAGQPVSPAAYAQLEWRLVGPFRGGWATMAGGVAGSPDTFYFSGAG